MSLLKKLVKRLFGVLKVFAPIFSCVSKIESIDARKKLEDYSPKPTGNPIRTNIITEPICDLQIIIPAYNVEKYLNDCVNSILLQETKYTYKIVLIDDGSTDNTSKIADQYIEHENVIVIHQENRGFSGARNRGLEELFAKYIMFVDSDDMLSPGAIESMLDAAFAYDSDIVEGGAQFLKDNQLETSFSYRETKELPTPLGIFHGQPWAKVYKAECFANIVFPEGYWFEDSILSFLIYPVKTKVSVVSQFVYIYRFNDQGITATHRKRIKAIDTYWVIETLMETRKELGMVFDEAFFNKMLRQLVLNQTRLVKLPEEVQESAFVLSAELLLNYFPSKLFEDNKKNLMVRALLEKDWGIYRFYSKFS